MRTPRKLFSGILRDIMEEKSSWNVIGIAGMDIEAERDFYHRNLLIKLCVRCSLSYDKELRYFTYALKPIVGIEGADGWVVVDSPGSLTRLYGQNFLKGMDENPALFLDESSVALPILERFYEGYDGSYIGDFSDRREGGSFVKRIAPFEQEKIEELQQIILRTAISLISDQNVGIKGEIPLIFGIWPAEKFAKEFNIGVEDLMYIEERMQESVDGSKVVTRLSGFAGIVRISFLFKKLSEVGSLANKLELHALGTFFMKGDAGPFVAELLNFLVKKKVNRLLIDDAKAVKELVHDEMNEIVKELVRRRRKEVSRPEILGSSGTSVAREISGAKSI
ncbi:MAG: hypothetical protein ACUX7D_04730 [Candidatus Methanodesulfokora washburnensis]|jgi:hypothetical protein